MEKTNTLKDVDNNKFLYFAYGSNMLEERLHCVCPSARIIGVGAISNMALTFNGASKRWNGGTADIRYIHEFAAEHQCIKDKCGVWGVLWEIEKNEKSYLDTSEGVDVGEYEPFFPNVTSYFIKNFNDVRYSLDKEIFQNKLKRNEFLYDLHNERNALQLLHEAIQSSLTVDFYCFGNITSCLSTEIVSYRQCDGSYKNRPNKPSLTYLLTCMKGAAENFLPIEYLNNLASVQSNDRDAEFKPWLIRTKSIDPKTKIPVPQMPAINANILTA